MEAERTKSTGLLTAVLYCGRMAAAVVVCGLLNRFVLHHDFYHGIEIVFAVSVGLQMTRRSAD